MDENQLYLNTNIVKYKTFETEEEGKNFIKNWQGEQLGSLVEAKKWYVALPNDVSLGISEAIKETEKLTRLNVPLGYEYVVANNWYLCH